jgi:hypothetical protein
MKKVESDFDDILFCTMLLVIFGFIAVKWVVIILLNIYYLISTPILALLQ